MMKLRGPRQFSQSTRIAILVLFFIALLALYSGIFISIQQSRRVLQERIRMYTNSFAQLQEKTDAQITSLLQLSNIAHDNHQMRNLALRECGIVDVLNGQTQIKQILASSGLLNQVYYYVTQNQKLYDGGVVYSFPESAPYFVPFEGMDANQTQQILTANLDDNRLLLLPACKTMGSVGYVVVAVLPVPYNATLMYAKLLLEIRVDKLLKAILPAGIDTDALYAFYREDGALLFSNGSERLSSLITVPKNGEESFEESGVRYLRYRAEQYGIARFTYEMYIPEEALYRGTFSACQENLMIAGCVILFLLLCPILYLWTYEPMRVLIEKLRSAPADGEKRRLLKNDYLLALREIEQMRSVNSSLLWQVDSSINLVRASLLKRLIKFGDTSDHFMALCRHTNLILQYPYFRLILASSLAIFKEGGMGEFTLLTQPAIDLYIVKEPDLMYLLVNAQTEGAITSAQVIQLLEKAMGQEAKNLYLARSRWMTDFSDLPKAYQITMEKLSQRTYHCAPGIKEDAEPAANSIDKQYPVNEILQLRESVMEGNWDHICEAMRLIQSYLLHENTFNTVAILAACDSLRVLQKCCETDLGPLLNRINQSLSTAADVCNTLQESLTIIRDERENKQTQTDMLKEQMLLYVSEMLENPNLSLATASEYFDMSESTFSHAFKRRTGINFVKYVTDLKIQRAKTLLICTEQSIDAISDLLNYASASSFARMFKGETGLTPTQYRKLRDNA